MKALAALLVLAQRGPLCLCHRHGSTWELPGKVPALTVSGNAREAGWCALESGGQGSVLTSALTAPVGLVSFCSARFVVQAALWSSRGGGTDPPPPAPAGGFAALLLLHQLPSRVRYGT